MIGTEVEVSVHALESLGLADLRTAWDQHFGAPHPRHRSPELLLRLMAWRLQAQNEGGLDAAARRLLARRTTQAPGPVLTPGVRITREYRGRRCDVEVLAEGFLYQGQAYDSLSEIAREITGVRWNGPRFFGLRKEART